MKTLFLLFVISRVAAWMPPSCYESPSGGDGVGQAKDDYLARLGASSGAKDADNSAGLFPETCNSDILTALEADPAKILGGRYLDALLVPETLTFQNTDIFAALNADPAKILRGRLLDVSGGPLPLEQVPVATAELTPTHVPTTGKRQRVVARLQPRKLIKPTDSSRGPYGRGEGTFNAFQPNNNSNDDTGSGPGAEEDGLVDATNDRGDVGGSATVSNVVAPLRDVVGDGGAWPRAMPSTNAFPSVPEIGKRPMELETSLPLIAPTCSFPTPGATPVESSREILKNGSFSGCGISEGVFDGRLRVRRRALKESNPLQSFKRDLTEEMRKTITLSGHPTAETNKAASQQNPEVDKVMLKGPQNRMSMANRTGKYTRPCAPPKSAISTEARVNHPNYLPGTCVMHTHGGYSDQQVRGPFMVNHFDHSRQSWMVSYPDTDTVHHFRALNLIKCNENQKRTLEEMLKRPRVPSLAVGMLVCFGSPKKSYTVLGKDSILRYSFKPVEGGRAIRCLRPKDLEVMPQGESNQRAAR